MRQYPSDIAFTPAVKAVQEAVKRSRAAYAKVERRGWPTRVTPDLAEFLAGLDMFYLGTASAEGQPYIQFRPVNCHFGARRGAFRSPTIPYAAWACQVVVAQG
jgi:hypothetical protein